MGKVRITVRISRYQKEKELGDLYRAIAEPGQTFSEFKREYHEQRKRQKNKQMCFSQQGMPSIKPLSKRSKVKNIKRRKPKASISRGTGKPKTKPKTKKSRGGHGYGY